MSGAVPLALTVNVAVWPAVTVCALGCDEIAGATGLVIPPPEPEPDPQAERHTAIAANIAN